MKKYLLLSLAAYLLLLSVGEALAQIELEGAFPGKAANGYTAPPIGTRMDFTGDGVPDMVFIPPDFPVLIIHDGAEPTIQWFIPEVDDTVIITFAKATVIGYFELDGSNSFKEIILAEKKGQRFINPIVIDINGTVLWDGSGKELLTIANMDGDTCDEIVAGNPAVPQVEIWGEKK